MTFLLWRYVRPLSKLNVADYRKWEASGMISGEHIRFLHVNCFTLLAQGIFSLAVQESTVTLLDGATGISSITVLGLLLLEQ
jgi:hypothetical protein